MAAFLITAMICAFQVRSLEMVNPKSLASPTTFIRSPPIATGGKSQLIEASEIGSSLHLSILNIDSVPVGPFSYLIIGN